MRSKYPIYSEYIKTFTGVIKRTPKEVRAVEDVSFDIHEGELFGLLGPNGAGKTTTVKMLTTLLIPTAGHARVLGFDVVKQADQVRRRIGFIFGGERGLYWRLSGIDNLRYFASLYHVDPEVSKKRIPYLLEMVGLQDRGEEKVRGLLARHEAAPAHRPHPAARPGDALPGRADHRAGPGRRPRAAPGDPATCSPRRRPSC